MTNHINPGDVVYFDFPLDDGGHLKHYGLVVQVEDTITNRVMIRVAYGSTKKVSVTGHLPHEFVLAEPEELERAGLKKPTRFDLRRTIRLCLEDGLELRGSIDLRDGRILKRLETAIKAI